MMFASLGMNAATACLAIVQSSGFVTIPPGPPVRHTNSLAVKMPLCSGLGDDTEAKSPPLTALEFYSGIGGLRISLERATEAVGLNVGDAIVVGSYEINAVANSVYEQNFLGCRVTRRSIEHLSAQELDGVADIWLLSPPCQPFCRVGKQMDIEDPRSLSFIHLLFLLETVTNPPDHIFVENVRGFEGSRAHQRLLEVLSTRGFDVEQYMMSPVQLGIPNTRLRYYCLASRGESEDGGRIVAIQDSLPRGSLASLTLSIPMASAHEGDGSTLRPLSEYLDPSLIGEATVPLLLSPKAAAHANPSLRFDVVTASSTETTTFTKGYGKHAGRAGPVILLTDDAERRVSEEVLERFPSGLYLGPNGRELRWFSDREMLRLHGFPEAFGFPACLTLPQRFGLIGNSVNVEVVALLLRRMLFRGDVRRLGMGEQGSNMPAPIEA